MNTRLSHQFEGKVVLITGASSGVGAALARAFAQSGARVVLNARRAERLRSLCDELAEVNRGRAVFLAGDVGTVATCRELVSLSVQSFGRLDVVVNNAGIFRAIPFLEHTEAEFALNIDTLLKGPFFLTQATIPQMLRQKSGCVINIGSIWGFRAIELYPSAAHAAAKAALHVLTASLAAEFAESNIRINALAPGLVDKRATEPLAGTLRRRGTVHDVVSAVLFLASDEASWITGTTIPVDGGATAQHRLPYSPEQGAGSS